MNIKEKLTKILALAGTVLVWIPILFTLLASIVESFATGSFMFDYLLPMKLFPFTALGSLLLLWASSSCHIRYKLIIYGLFAQIFLLDGGMIFASLSGLASGAIEATGFIWMIMVITIIFYYTALIEVCTSGFLLVSDLFCVSKSTHSQNATASTDEELSR